ncbi:hypothetical protein ABZS88_37415 [Streptomyces sp. NPDC005480]|uniref:hypothetical protein n=1 Tax=Streptomyces sp. NPDC005480 TaxID=3154880 RepID=UPI0033B6D2D4
MKFQGCGRRSRPAGDSAPAAAGPYAIERGTMGAGALLSVDVQPALTHLQPLHRARVLTRIQTPDGLNWGVGRCHFVNTLSGRTAVRAATAPPELPRSDKGRRLLRTTIRFLEGKRPSLPLVDGAPHLIPRATRTGDVHRLAVANGSADSAQVRIHLPTPRHPVRSTPLAPLSQPTRAAVATNDDGWALEPELPHRGWAVFEW